MFRKITSNRDPGATLWSELRREFGTYFNKAGSLTLAVCKGNPKTVFGLMLALLLFSAVLSFTLFRHPNPPPKQLVKVKPVHILDDGFGRILQTTAQLQETLRLKKLVDSLSGKPTLTAADSAALESALDQLSRINK